jgi:hypothetical protein
VFVAFIFVSFPWILAIFKFMPVPFALVPDPSSREGENEWNGPTTTYNSIKAGRIQILLGTETRRNKNNDKQHDRLRLNWGWFSSCKSFAVFTMFALP